MKILNRSNKAPALRVLDSNLHGRCRNAVVECKKHLRAIENRASYFFVDCNLSGEEGAYIPLKQPRAVFIIDVCKHAAGDHAQITAILIRRSRARLQARNAVNTILPKVNLNDLAPLIRAAYPIQAINVPNLPLRRDPIVRFSLDVFKRTAHVCIGKDEESIFSDVLFIQPQKINQIGARCAHLDLFIQIRLKCSL